MQYQKLTSSSQQGQYRLRVMLQGNIGPVACIVAHPLGTHIACGGEDGTKLWDLQTSRLLSSPIKSSHRGTTTAIAWIVRPDDTEEALAFGTSDGFLCIWKREKEENFIEVYCNRLVGGPDGVEISGIAYDTSTGQLAVVQRSESIHRFIIDPSMKPVVVKSVQIPQHWPQAVCFGQTGVGGPEIWSFGREDGMIHVLNESGKVLKSKLTGTVIGHAAINVKEDALIIDDVSQGVAVFKFSTTDRLKTFDVPFTTRRLRSVAFHDGNSAIITGSDHGQVYIFNRRTGDVIDKIDIGIKDWVQSVATVDKNGVPLVFIGRSGTNITGKNDVQVWEKVSAPPKEDRTRKGFREEAIGLMCLLSILFVMENILRIPITDYFRRWLEYIVWRMHTYLSTEQTIFITELVTEDANEAIIYL